MTTHEQQKETMSKIELDLNSLFENSLAKAFAQEKVQAYLDVELEKFVQAHIADLFRYRGELRQPLEKAITESLKVRDLNLARIALTAPLPLASRCLVVG
jgi:hypothetical protein